MGGAQFDGDKHPAEPGHQPHQPAAPHPGRGPAQHLPPGAIRIEADLPALPLVAPPEPGPGREESPFAPPPHHQRDVDPVAAGTAQIDPPEPLASAFLPPGEERLAADPQRQRQRSALERMPPVHPQRAPRVGQPGLAAVPQAHPRPHPGSHPGRQRRHRQRAAPVLLRGRARHRAPLGGVLPGLLERAGGVPGEELGRQAHHAGHLPFGFHVRRVQQRDAPPAAHDPQHRGVRPGRADPVQHATPANLRNREG